MSYCIDRAWAEVNIDNIEYNVKEIKKIIDKKVEICGVVKADAYGHGVLEVAKTLIENGVTFLSVSILDEAIQLREKGINIPILVLGYTDPRRCDEIILNNITQTVFSYDLAIALSKSAVKLGKDVKIHIKVDTGMTRIGFMPGYSAVKNIIEISKLPRIIIEGLFTHFASADELDKSYTEMQFEKFMNICNELDRVGVYIPIKHVCNSAALIQFPHMHLNMVRLGIILYGFYPSEEVDKDKIKLRPAMQLKSNITLVKDVEKDTFISYGRIYKTQVESKIATIPIGYADGYTRLLNTKTKVIVNGDFAPVVGKICMDQCMIDVTNVKSKVSVGDEVVLFGKQGDNEIKVEEIATLIGTINYEIICIVGKRVPRVYLKDGKVDKILNYLI